MRTDEKGYTISVVRFQAYENKSLRGFADVEIGFGSSLIKLKGYKIMEGANGVYALPPSTESKKDGKSTWFDSLEFDQTLDYAIKDVVVAAYNDNSLVAKSLIPPKVKKTFEGTKITNVQRPVGATSQASNNDDDIPF